MSEPPDYVAAFLREADRDRYYATLFLPPARRRAVQALYAFSADVAAIRDRAREPAAGEFRLQWWIDALEGDGHGNVRQNPIAAALLDTISEFGLPAGALIRLLRARRFDLYQDPMPDVASFEGYAGETVSTPYQLAAMILNGGEEIETGDAAGHLGVAHALVGHLRAFGYNASQGRVFLPMAVLSANGVTDREILTGTESEGLAEALGQIADMAAEHIAQARTAIGTVPKALRPVFAPVALVASQLQQVRENRRFFAAPDEIADWRKLVIMWWWNLRH
ncbi:phytoene/squalene synthase family protein [Devosia sp.]|uniref:phytoene/squalene synthase family protein n=1 Tax=Devosia sp. TaxID=1871048 RepID=UPI003A93C19E